MAGCLPATALPARGLHRGTVGAGVMGPLPPSRQAGHLSPPPTPQLACPTRQLHHLITNPCFMSHPTPSPAGARTAAGSSPPPARGTVSADVTGCGRAAGEGFSLPSFFKGVDDNSLANRGEKSADGDIVASHHTRKPGDKGSPRLCCCAICRAGMVGLIKSVEACPRRSSQN